MTASARDQLHRAIENLPDERVGVAAELLEALASHDERVVQWRASLSVSQVAEIAASLRQQHAAEEWIADEAIDGWLNSEDEAPPMG
jgi:hypothetical protein